ncbi:Integrase core domain protein [Mariniflexile rhizosphaerae]|uniref:IS3 family transposase n=1 Tax=Mariniflexile sp. TRM1-10 TaxID=2027857 RepID=UPI000E334E54|nr:IS3 family transposase [Mariniflexile sp. TRM1-10]AXP82773.1 Integrase core domain protein [Mariniflexile sp. TRM1-10]
MNQLYRTIGISKQAVHQYAKRQAVFDKKVMGLVMEADRLREDHPGCGVEKMYDTLRPDFMGRDRFVETFMELGYRLKRKKNFRRTTFSSNVSYPNLIKGMEVNAPSVIWQSDITYVRVGEKFYYAVFIIDVYTKKIVGHQVSDHMRASANIKALQMALKSNKAPQVHHSDRGSQYIYSKYIDLLKSKGCEISMAKTAQDNAYAERINRTIKNDYIELWKPKSFEQLKRMVKKAVNQYNTVRPHNNIGRISPMEFENRLLMKSTFHQQSITIFNNEINV